MFSLSPLPLGGFPLSVCGFAGCALRAGLGVGSRPSAGGKGEKSDRAPGSGKHHVGESGDGLVCGFDEPPGLDAEDDGAGFGVAPDGAARQEQKEHHQHCGNRGAPE